MPPMRGKPAANDESETGSACGRDGGKAAGAEGRATPHAAARASRSAPHGPRRRRAPGASGAVIVTSRETGVEEESEPASTREHPEISSRPGRTTTSRRLRHRPFTPPPPGELAFGAADGAGEEGGRRPPPLPPAGPPFGGAGAAGRVAYHSGGQASPSDGTSRYTPLGETALATACTAQWMWVTVPSYAASR